MLRIRISGQFYYFTTSVELYNSPLFNTDCDVEKFNGIMWVVE